MPRGLPNPGMRAGFGAGAQRRSNAICSHGLPGMRPIFEEAVVCTIRIQASTKGLRTVAQCGARSGPSDVVPLCLRDKGWRVFASTAVIETPIISDVRLCVIGVDFDVGFVSMSETDRFGNIVAGQDVPMVTAGLSKHATQTAISAAVKSVVAVACRVQKADLDRVSELHRKECAVVVRVACRQRMLSSFPYMRFAQTIGARAHDAGIEVVEVRAAYSSKSGAQKYARRYGLSGHRAAAFVLARPKQHFPDRLKPSSRKRFATTCKDRRELVPARAKARCLAQGKGDRRRARLETYLRPPAMATPATPQRPKRPEIESRKFAVKPRGVIPTPVRVRA
jgi:hypothetical protein